MGSAKVDILQLQVRKFRHDLSTQNIAHVLTDGKGVDSIHQVGFFAILNSDTGSKQIADCTSAATALFVAGSSQADRIVGGNVYLTKADLQLGLFFLLGSFAATSTQLKNSDNCKE